MTARYRQIAAALRADIESGYYPPRALLPAISELTKKFKVSRVTASAAIELLENEGLVRAISGRGTIVQDRRPVKVPLSRYAAVLQPGGNLGPWQRACQAAGVDGDMVMVDVAREAASSNIAEALGIPAGTLTVRRDRRATIDGQTVQLHTAWYAADLVAGTPLAEEDRVEGGVYGALTAAGHAPRSADETLSGRIATAEESTELRLREAAFVLVIERITRDTDGHPLELLRVVADPARSQFVYDGLPLI